MQWLINKGLKHIFYPSIPYERNEFGDAVNHYNCPIVTSYPENIKNNMDPIVNGEVDFIHPFLSFASEETLSSRLIEELGEKFSITSSEIKEAVHKAWIELEECRNDMRKKGEETVAFLDKTGNRGIVLAGRPYHIDPEVNHGIDTLITRAGAAVITEDSISNRVEKFPTTVLNQWTYHSRLYAAARYCTEQPDMDLVQLVSFGCGLDAVTTDETREILQAGGKLYTQLKIDEITNLGAVRIRLRSLFAALDEQDEARETARKEA